MFNDLKKPLADLIKFEFWPQISKMTLTYIWRSKSIFGLYHSATSRILDQDQRSWFLVYKQTKISFFKLNWVSFLDSTSISNSNQDRQGPLLDRYHKQQAEKKDKSHFTVDYFEFQDKKRGLENDVWASGLIRSTGQNAQFAFLCTSVVYRRPK